MKNNQKYIAAVLLTALLLTGCGQKEQAENAETTETTPIAAEQTDTTETGAIKEGR